VFLLHHVSLFTWFKSSGKSHSPCSMLSTILFESDDFYCPSALSFSLSPSLSVPLTLCPYLLLRLCLRCCPCLRIRLFFPCLCPCLLLQVRRPFGSVRLLGTSSCPCCIIVSRLHHRVPVASSCPCCIFVFLLHHRVPVASLCSCCIVRSSRLQ
jgi:hypothetical protein